jgi:hypothetical protein
MFILALGILVLLIITLLIITQLIIASQSLALWKFLPTMGFCHEGQLARCRRRQATERLPVASTQVPHAAARLASLDPADVQSVFASGLSMLDHYNHQDLLSHA